MATPKKRSIEQLADIIEITPREIERLAKDGVLPRPSRGNYPLVLCIQAYIRYWKNIAAGRTGDPTIGSLEDARRRKTSAEAELAEMELGQLRGSLVTIEDHTKQLSAILERLRARLLNLPGKYAPGILGIRTITEAQLRLEAAVAEAMAELAESGESEDEAAGAQEVA